MSKHTFPKGHKFGGNKPKPYRTKAVGVRVPEDIHAECVAVVTYFYYLYSINTYLCPIKVINNKVKKKKNESRINERKSKSRIS